MATAVCGDGPGGTASAVAHWKNLGLNVEAIDLAKILKDKNLAVRKGGGNPIVREGAKSRNPSKKLPTQIMAMLFADAVNFSKLTEPQIPRFLNHFLGAIGSLISTSRHAPLIKNTWGDGLYFVFADVRHAGLLALELIHKISAPSSGIQCSCLTF